MAFLLEEGPASLPTLHIIDNNKTIQQENLTIHTLLRVLRSSSCHSLGRLSAQCGHTNPNRKFCRDPLLPPDTDPSHVGPSVECSQIFALSVGLFVCSFAHSHSHVHSRTHLPHHPSSRRPAGDKATTPSATASVAFPPKTTISRPVFRL